MNEVVNGKEVKRINASGGYVEWADFEAMCKDRNRLKGELVAALNASEKDGERIQALTDEKNKLLLRIKDTTCLVNMLDRDASDKIKRLEELVEYHIENNTKLSEQIEELREMAEEDKKTLEHVKHKRDWAIAACESREKASDALMLELSELKIRFGNQTLANRNEIVELKKQLDDMTYDRNYQRDQVFNQLKTISDLREAYSQAHNDLVTAKRNIRELERTIKDYDRTIEDSLFSPYREVGNMMWDRMERISDMRELNKNIIGVIA